jgi:hypothetical protein
VPIVERDFLPDRLGEERKRSSQVLILAAILIAVLMLGTIAGQIGQIGNSKETLPSETPMRTSAGILYTKHSPISIIGNGGFTNASGVVWGSGTASDPYIIANWDITASTAAGISIQGTDAHFIVRNCYAHGGSFVWDGIDLSNCVNGTLENNNCSNDYVGIFLFPWSCSVETL